MLQTLLSRQHSHLTFMRAFESSPVHCLKSWPSGKHHRPANGGTAAILSQCNQTHLNIHYRHSNAAHRRSILSRTFWAPASPCLRMRYSLTHVTKLLRFGVTLNPKPLGLSKSSTMIGGGCSSMTSSMSTKVGDRECSSNGRVTSVPGDDLEVSYPQ